jgi:NDP-sugar pyrophosphorylase family protein
MQCVILAGGLATRLRPLTEKIPKTLLEIGPFPFVHYQLKHLSQQGVDRVVFCIGYKGEMIREAVGDGSQWSLQVSYSDEGPDLKGTGGALRLALERELLDEKFFILYGDSYLPIDFGEIWNFFLRGSEPALMTVMENQDKWDSSNAVLQGNKVKLYDKKLKSKPEGMKFVDYGLSALTRSLVAERIPTGEKFDLADLFHALSLENQLSGFEVKERFFEVGSFAGLEDFRRYTLRKDG